jgi:rhamnulokinase
MGTKNYLAFDLGAESGRAVLGTLADGRLSTREIRRFPNGPVDIGGRLRWDVFRLLAEMTSAIRECAALGVRPVSVGIDTWGVDFGILGPGENLSGLPLCYRDPGLIGAMEDLLGRVPREKVYDLTGVQFLPFNSLYQLHALAGDKSRVLDSASSLLFMPDLFNFLLTGTGATEYTIASTSQLLDPRTRTWARELLTLSGIPSSILKDIIPPGTPLGPISSRWDTETLMPGLLVAATAGHDTAAAVAAVPAAGNDWVYISSGTWSLVGAEIDEPIITPESLAGNFTNEGGVGERIRFLKNVSGLWLLQQCRKKWSPEKTWTYDELTEMAASCPAFGAPLIDPDSPDFLNPPDMPGAIDAFCLRTGQSPPSGVGVYARCILDSLALKYRFVLERLERIRRRRAGVVHIIGGGSRNRLLCRLTADAMGIPVVAGPAEASAAGNILVQAMSAGDLADLEEIRAVSKRSFEPARYEAKPSSGWDDAYRRFRSILSA